MKLMKFNKGQSLNKFDSNKNNSNIKRKTIVTCAVVLVFTILLFSFAKYESSKDYNLINGIVAQPAVDLKTKLISLYEKGSTDLAYDGTSDLGTNATADNNLRYIGNNPNNFIYFNCSSSDLSSCEKWRIIGLFNNVQTLNGSEQLVKIIRAESIGNYSWDSSSSTINAGMGINQWGESGTYEGSDLMRELNKDYLGNITVGTDGKWFSGTNNSKSNKPTSVLVGDIPVTYIKTVVWNTGSNPSSIDLTNIANLNSITLLPKQIYDFERGTDVSNTCKLIVIDEDNCNDNVTRTSSWTGKVGLMYFSDFLYATSGSSTMTRNQCFNTSVFNWGNCGVKSWLYSSYVNGRTVSSNKWTMTTYNNGDKTGAMAVSPGSQIILSTTSNAIPVYPTVYLPDYFDVVSGDGSESNPFVIKFNSPILD